MRSRSDGHCSRFAPTRRPSNPHRLKPPRRWRGLLIGKHQLVELQRFRLMQLGHEVAVSVERGLDRGVTQLHLDVLRVGAVGDQQAGIRVAEVVEPDAAELGPPERCRELPVPEVVGIERRSPIFAVCQPTSSSTQ